MSAIVSIRHAYGYGVTEAGRAAARQEETCPCVRLRWGKWILCPMCETVYGDLRHGPVTMLTRDRKPD